MGGPGTVGREGGGRGARPRNQSFRQGQDALLADLTVASTRAAMTSEH